MTDKDKTTANQDKPADKIKVDAAGNATLGTADNKTKSDKDPVADNVKKGASKSTANPDPKKAADKGQPVTGGKKPSSKNKLLTYFLILLIILVLALGAALFYQQQQYQAMKTDMQKLSDSNVAMVKKAESDAAAALRASEEQNEKINSLNKILDNTSSQLQEIDRALQLVTDSGSDLLLLNDIDHLVTVAEQQLLLGGNVANAIISLEAAQAQLARANRAAFASLQQAINGDIDKLRAVAKVNLSALSNKVDELVELIGSAPLIVPDAVNTESDSQKTGPMSNKNDADDDGSEFEAPSGSITEKQYWSQLSKDIWQQSKILGSALSSDLKELFDIRKIDDEAALLMSPDQAQRFRETLSQRAITAQLALLMQQTKIWHEELEKISAAVAKRYDMSSQQSRNALKLARELYDTTIEVQLPKLKNTLSAIAAVRDEMSAQENEAESAEQAAAETN